LGAEEHHSSGNAKYYIFILVLVALLNLIDGLDSTIVNIALNDIATDLDCDMKATSWIVIAYMLPTIGFIVLFGKLFQTRTIKKILVFSVIVFGITSLMCGVSDNINMLVFFRFLQGLSGAALLSATPILVVRELPESKLSIGMAVMAIVTGIATTLGPTIGSIITESPLKWNGIFLINIPICLIIVLLIIFGYKENTKAVHNTSTPSLPICICYAFAVMGIVLTVTTLEAINKDPVQLVCLGAVFAASIIAGVIVYRHCVDGKHPHPLFHKTLLQNKEVILTTSSFICTTITSAIITYLLPFYLKKCMGVENAGIYFAVSSIITIVCSVIAGKWCQKYGCKTLTIWAIVFRMCFACIFLVITPEMGWIPIYIGLAFMGVSFGFSGTSQPTRIVQHAAKEDKEDASNIMLTANYLGAALGTALAVIVMYIAIPGAYEMSVKDFSSDMIMTGMHACAAFSLIVNLIALVCTLKVRNIVPHDEEENREEPVSQ